jgi:Tfp pilus assembly protein PilO
MKLGLREMFVLMLTLGVLCAGYFFVYVPSSIQWNELRADIRLNQRALADLAIATRNAHELDSNAAAMRREIAHFTQGLPPETKLPEMVEDFSRAARQNHLMVQRIDAQKRMRLAIYSQQTVRILLSGDCGDVYQFLQQIESSDRTGRLTEMSLHKANPDGGVSADLAICLYFSPAPGGGAPSQTASIQPGGHGE